MANHLEKPVKCFATCGLVERKLKVIYHGNFIFYFQMCLLSTKHSRELKEAGMQTRKCTKASQKSTQYTALWLLSARTEQGMVSSYEECREQVQSFLILVARNIFVCALEATTTLDWITCMCWTLESLRSAGSWMVRIPWVTFAATCAWQKFHFANGNFFNVFPGCFAVTCYVKFASI